MQSYYFVLLVAVAAGAAWDSSEEINQEGLVNTIINTVRTGDTTKVNHILEGPLEEIVGELHQVVIMLVSLLGLVFIGLCRDIYLRRIEALKPAK